MWYTPTKAREQDLTQSLIFNRGEYFSTPPGNVAASAVRPVPPRQQATSPGFVEVLPKKAPTRGAVWIYDDISQVPLSTVSRGCFMAITSEAMAANAIGSQCGVQTFQAEVPACSEWIKHILLQQYSGSGTEKPPRSSEGNHLVRVKLFSWDYDMLCECTECILERQRKQSRNQKPGTHSPGRRHIPENAILRKYYQEMAAMTRVSGLRSMQRIVAAEVSLEQMNAKIVCKYVDK